jgi:hypothetical protein
MIDKKEGYFSKIILNKSTLIIVLIITIIILVLDVLSLL